MHRFGTDSLNDLLIHNSPLREYQDEEEIQGQTILMDEIDEEETQEQTKIELSKLLKI